MATLLLWSREDENIILSANVNNIMSKPFSLNINDAAKAVVVVVLVAVIGGIQQMLTKHGLDFGAYDWGFILNLAISAGGAYLTKNFFESEDGSIKTPLGTIAKVK